MNPTNFVKKYLYDAQVAASQTGINEVAILSQAALETGWGESVKGNNFYGIKADRSWKGEKQLLVTREELRTKNAKFPEILSITDNGDGTYTYIVKDYFRKYETASDSFIDYSRFFFENSRYRKAIKVRGNWKKFLKRVAKAGYATDPNYAKILLQVGKMIEKIIKDNKLEVNVKS